MSDDYSEGEGGGGHEANPVDTTEDMEIELNLPQEVDGERHRFEPPNGARSKWPDTDFPSRVLWNLVVQ